MRARFVIKGGPGSGHKGHAGRPGRVGGSLPGEGGTAGDLGPFVSDLSAYLRAYKYITNTQSDNPMPRPWDVHAELHNVEKYARDYDAANKGLEIWNHGDYVNGEWVPGVNEQITAEQFNYIHSKVKARSDERVKLIQEIAGIDESLLEGLDLQQSYYSVATDSRYDMLDLMDTKAQTIIQNIKDNGYELYDFSADELNYKLFSELEKVEGDKRSSYLDPIGLLLEQQQEFDIKHEITLGNMTPEEGARTGSGDVFKPQGREWQELPARVYHAATNAEVIAADQLRSRRELGMR